MSWVSCWDNELSNLSLIMVLPSFPLPPPPIGIQRLSAGIAPFVGLSWLTSLRVHQPGLFLSPLVFQEAHTSNKRESPPVFCVCIRCGFFSSSWSEAGPPTQAPFRATLEPQDSHAYERTPCTRPLYGCNALLHPLFSSPSSPPIRLDTPLSLRLRGRSSTSGFLRRGPSRSSPWARDTPLGPSPFSFLRAFLTVVIKHLRPLPSVVLLIFQCGIIKSPASLMAKNYSPTPCSTSTEVPKTRRVPA